MARKVSAGGRHTLSGEAASAADLLRRGRVALISEVAREARDSVEAGTPRDFLRSAHAVQMLATASRDGDVVNEAAERAAFLARGAAGLPSGTCGQVAAKLAWALRDLAEFGMANNGGEGEVARFVMIATAMADLVLIGDRPIGLPHRACEPIADRADADFWLSRQEAAVRRS